MLAGTDVPAERGHPAHTGAARSMHRAMGGALQAADARCRCSYLVLARARVECGVTGVALELHGRVLGRARACRRRRLRYLKQFFKSGV